MRIPVVVPCVGYDDFLSLTLGRTLALFERVTVLTAHNDCATIELARKHGASVMLSMAWSDGIFNKAKALNEWLAQVQDDCSWRLVLDADILLPEDMVLDLQQLDPEMLYGARRRMCENEQDWLDFVGGQRTFDSFPLEVLHVKNGRIWRRPTHNAAGLCGFFHLWNVVDGAGARLYPVFPTAASYDLAFAMSFAETRAYVPGLEVLHLGRTHVNWAGRRSSRWTVPLA